MNIATQPKHFPPGEGKTVKLGRMAMNFTTTKANDWNAHTVCEAIEPPESGAGYHRHPTYNETFIICERHYDFCLDGKQLMLDTGSSTSKASGEAKAIATKYGLEFLSP